MPHASIATVIVLGSLVASGCAGLSSEQNAQLSSGYLGCRPDEITIQGEQGHSLETWTASCRGRTFHCMRGGEMLACSEDYKPTSGGELAPVAPAIPQSDPIEADPVPAP